MPVYHNWGFPRLGSRTGQNVYNDLMGIRSRLLLVQYSVSVATSATDAAVVTMNVVPGGYTGTQNYIITSAVYTNASSTLGGGSPAISVWTGAGGTGTQLITGTSLAGLTTSVLAAEVTASSPFTNSQANTLYLRVTGTAVAGATVDVYLFGVVFP